MRSFLHFTCITLWGEFTWVEAIIFGETFIVRRQFSVGLLSYRPGGEGNFPRGQLSSGAIARGAIIQGVIIRGAIFLGSNCPRTDKNGSS